MPLFSVITALFNFDLLKDHNEQPRSFPRGMLPLSPKPTPSIISNIDILVMQHYKSATTTRVYLVPVQVVLEAQIRLLRPPRCHQPQAIVLVDTAFFALV